MIAASSPGLDVGTITSLDELGRVRAEWDELVRALPRPSPFLLHAWLDAWWRHYGQGAGLAIPTVRADGALVAAAPLFVRRHLGVSVTGFIGGEHSALADLLLAPGADPRILERLATRLESQDPGYLDAHGLPRGSRLADVLGDRIEVIARVEAPVLDLAGGWDAVYEAKTTSKKRNLHRRRRRQLAELGRLEVAVAREPDALVAALHEAFRLHELRWAGRPDGSGFAGPTGRRSSASRSTTSRGSSCSCSTGGRSRSTTTSPSRVA
jgi:CelD/BcsL family acetyltransferase involved in cellulose biosynthesis